MSGYQCSQQLRLDGIGVDAYVQAFKFEGEYYLSVSKKSGPEWIELDVKDLTEESRLWATLDSDGLKKTARNE